MQNTTVNQIARIIDGIPSISGQADGDKPIDERGTIEGLVVQSTVGKPIGSDRIFAVFQMMTYELIANESGFSVFAQRGRPLTTSAHLLIAAFHFAPILDDFFPYFIGVGDKARRNEDTLSEIQESLQK